MGVFFSLFFEAASDLKASSEPQSFSTASSFFGLLKIAPWHAPVAQPPSTPAQQGMEQECEDERTASGSALDKMASVKSAAESARTRGRVWEGRRSKGEIKTSSQTIRTRLIEADCGTNG